MRLLVCALALMLVFGCLVPQEKAEAKDEIGKTLNISVKVPEKGLISVSGDENLSVVTVRAANVSGRWQFPMQDYAGEFESAGVYSVSFIKLNRSQIPWLEKDEAIWLTPMIRNGKGVLFNSVYTNEVANCSAGTVKILGKSYELDKLKRGSSFENDDKWKVALERPGGCVKRIIIYMDGYFSDLKDGDQIPLFRSDNTILIEFNSLASNPHVRIIATMPLQVHGTLPKDRTNETLTNEGTYVGYVNKINDPDIGAEYNFNQSIEADGIHMEFDPPLGVCWHCYADNSTYDRWLSDNLWYLTQAHHLYLDIGDKRWVLSEFGKGPESSRFVLAKEGSTTMLNLGESISADGKKLVFDSFNESDGIMRAIFRYNAGDNNLSIAIDEGGMAGFGKGHIRLWKFARASVAMASWIDVSYLSETLDLADPKNNATLIWVNPDSWENASLKSIFIPRSSPVYDRLAGAG